MKLETLSPVHVGSGEKYTTIDYVCEAGKLYVIDSGRLQRKLESRGLMERFIGLVKSVGSVDIGRFLRDNGVAPAEVASFVIPVKHHIRGMISIAINSQGRLYVPGSSIKGAIRTAYAYCKMSEVNDPDGRILRTMTNVGRGRGEIRSKEVFDKSGLLREIFAKEATKRKDVPHYDKMKSIEVSDSGFVSEADVGIYTLHRVGGRRAGVPMNVEAITPGVELELEVRFTPEVGVGDVIDTPEKLCRLVNEFARKVVSIEVGLINRYGLDEVVRFYKGLANELDGLEPNKCIMRVGFGKMFWDQTILPYFWEDKRFMGQFFSEMRRRVWRRGEGEPATIWCYVEDNVPKGVLGWVKLCF